MQSPWHHTKQNKWQRFKNAKDMKGKFLEGQNRRQALRHNRNVGPSSPFFPVHPGGCCLLCGRERGAEVLRVSFNPEQLLPPPLLPFPTDGEA